MKRFWQYFALEFIIIFIVSSAGYYVLHVPFNFPNIFSSSVVSGAIIAYALQLFFKGK